MYIVGSPGSGKSTLARRVSAITGARCVHLDEIQHRPDPTAKMGNRARDPGERDQIFAEIIKLEDWVIEDAGRACFADGLRCADKIVVLDLPRWVLYVRVVKRYVRQVLRIERASYRPSLYMLGLMFRWVREYDVGRFECGQDKFVRLRSGREARAYVKSLARGTKSAK